MGTLRIQAEIQTPADRFQGSNAYLRIYANAAGQPAFYSAEGVCVVTGQLGSPTWYQEYTCPITNGMITIPEVTLQATTDSNVPNATYTAQFYDAAGRQQNPKLSNFFVDPQYLESNVQSNIIVSGAGTSAANGVYTYRGQHNTRNYWNLEGQSDSTSNYAIAWTGTDWIMTNFSSATLYTIDTNSQYPWTSAWTIEAGNVGLAPVPAVAQDIIVIAATWAELTISNNIPCPNWLQYPDWFQMVKQYINLLGGIVPWASKLIGGKTYLTRDPDLSTFPIAVASNDYDWLAINKTIYLDGPEYLGSLTAAITGIGSTVCELRFTSNYSAVADITIPNNILCSFEGNGSITVASGHTVTIGSMRDQPEKQIFFGVGDVVLGKNAVTDLKLSWWAGIAGSGSDDQHAFNQLKESVTLNKGGRVSIGAGIWYCQNLQWGQTESHFEMVGAGAPIDGGSIGGTVIRLTDLTSTDPIMKMYQSVSQQIIRNICFDISTSTTGLAFEIEGVEGAGSAYNPQFPGCVFHSSANYSIDYSDPANWDRAIAKPLLRINSLGTNTDWEMVGLGMDHTLFNIAQNGLALWTNTVNSSFDMDRVQIQGQKGSVGWISKDSGWVTIKNRDIRGVNVDFNVGVTENLQRTQAHANVTFGTSSFVSADVDTSSSTIVIDDYTPYVGDRGQFTTAGSLPAGLSPATNYYVYSYDVQTGQTQFSTTTGTGSVPVSLTTTGSGTSHFVTNGTHVITVNAGTNPRFTMDDLGQQVIIGAFTTYATVILFDVAIYTYDLITTAYSDVNMGVYRQTKGTGLMYAGIIFAGNRAQTTIINGADEGCLNSYIFATTTTEIYSEVDVLNSTQQGHVDFNGTVIYRSKGSQYYSCSFTQSGGLGPIIYSEDLPLNTTLLRGTGSFIGYRVLPVGYLYGDNTHSFQKPVQFWAAQTDNFSNIQTQQMTHLVVYDQTPSGNANNDQPLLQSGTTLSQVGVIDKVLLWLGQINPVTLFRQNGYKFTRASADGFLTITGDQADAAFKGVRVVDQFLSNTSVTAPLITGTTKFTTAGSFEVSGKTTTSGFAYVTGSGATTVQGTSRTTAITCNGLSNIIQLNSASLPAGTEVTCTVTNTSITATHRGYLSIQSNYTPYQRVFISEINNGSFKITTFNGDTGANLNGPVVCINWCPGANS